MSDQPVADLLGGGGGDDAPPPNPFGGTAANGQDTKTGTSHASDEAANGQAANGNTCTTTDAYSFAPSPETPSGPSLNGAPETPSEKLSRGFGRLGGALNGLGATVGRGIKSASSAATTAVARTSERMDAVGSGANSPDGMRQMANGAGGASGTSGTSGAGGASGSNGGERKGPMMNVAMQRTLSGVAAASSSGSSANHKTQSALSNAAPNSGTSTGGTTSTGGFSLGSSFAALGSATASLTTSLGDGLSSTTTALSQSLATNLTRQYTMPDRTVASQVLMYRQLLHTECKPGLRLSRAFQGTPAQRAVMHMPVSHVMGRVEIFRMHKCCHGHLFASNGYVFFLHNIVVSF